jgi:sulfoxide reductase heme-binding subunit YedZ
MTFPKIVVFINSLIPLVLLLWDLYRNRVGPNPLEFATRTTGMLTLVFLSLTVAITPLRRIFGINSLVKSDVRLPLTFAFIVLFLLGYRLLVKYFPSDVTVSFYCYVEV